MLQKLHIQNYAIIDEIEIDFSNGLSIITGETGAGKSILMGALGLVLGDRTDTSVLFHTNKKCFVEGVFTTDNKLLITNFLQNAGLDNENELVLRREIAPNGKSRAFINDTPATLQQLKTLAFMLVDLHQQFDSLELGESGFQRDVIDALANNYLLLEKYYEIFFRWQTEKKQLEESRQQKDNFDKEFGYNQFLFDELEAVSFKENELEDLDNELKFLSNAEAIKTTLSNVYFQLKENEQPVVQTIKQIIQQLHIFSSHQKSIPLIIDRLQSAYVELQDIADEIDHINNSVHYDEKRIELINERLSTGYKLLKKHGVQTTSQLLQIQCALQEKLRAVLNIDEAIAVKEKEVKLLYQKAVEMAATISTKRKEQMIPFEKKVNALLAQVGMPNALVKVEMKETELNQFGKDSIEFLFDANKSNRFETLRKVASGGELSRLMLCVKSLVAQSMDMPTLIFDEIDSGISGEAAKQVGVILKNLSAGRQVICITHQPQIAGKGNVHFFVYKEIKGDAIKTNIRLLSQEERITVIAQMLGGERPTAAALQNAREMVMN